MMIVLDLVVVVEVKVVHLGLLPHLLLEVVEWVYERSSPLFLHPNSKKRTHQLQHLD